MKNTLKTGVLVASLAMLAGCATWSTASVQSAPGTDVTSTPRNANGSVKAIKVDPAKATAIVITENDITDRAYTVLGDVKVTVNKTTIFNKDPTHADIDARLREEAAKIDADAVVLVRYGTVGMGLASWGSLDGQGRAIKFK